MSQVINQRISKTREASISRKLDELLGRLRENNRATLDIYRDIYKLKRSNEISLNRAKKAVAALAKY